MKREAYTVKAPVTGMYDAISPSATMMEYTTDPRNKKEMKREPGPALDRAPPIPRNRPVPRAAPIAMNCKWRECSSRFRPSSDWPVARSVPGTSPELLSLMPWMYFSSVMSGPTGEVVAVASPAAIFSFLFFAPEAEREQKKEGN